MNAARCTVGFAKPMPRRMLMIYQAVMRGINFVCHRVGTFCLSTLIVWDSLLQKTGKDCDHEFYLVSTKTKLFESHPVTGSTGKTFKRENKKTITRYAP
jgi:hypothetical protein